MTIVVDIADRLYDYTDEEKAAEAVAMFQESSGLDDENIISLWKDLKDARRIELERLIFAAIDANGTTRRAQESVPNGIELYVEKENV